MCHRKFLNMFDNLLKIERQDVIVRQKVIVTFRLLRDRASGLLRHRDDGRHGCRTRRSVRTIATDRDDRAHHRRPFHPTRALWQLVGVVILRPARGLRHRLADRSTCGHRPTSARSALSVDSGELLQITRSACLPAVSRADVLIDAQLFGRD